MSENTRIECPECGWSKEVPQAAIGKMADCPSCNARFRLEAAPALEDALVEVPTDEPATAPPLSPPTPPDASDPFSEPDAAVVPPVAPADDDDRYTAPPSGWLGGLALLWRILGVLASIGSLVIAIGQFSNSIALAEQTGAGAGALSAASFSMGCTWLVAATFNFAVCFTIAEFLDAAKTIILRLGRRS